MQNNIAVQLTNISKVYKLYDKPVDRLKEALSPFKKAYHKDFYALKNINLEIKTGQVLGIVGVNGAGKSTLLKIIAGVLTPTHGKITINGKLNAILELGSGLKAEMTGVENINLNLQINGVKNKNIEKLTQETIEFADIGEHINQPIKTYSSGMKGRLGFGIATSTDPDILIVDEVLAVGDVLFQRKCYTRIEKLFKSGKTVIFVSHSAQSVIQFCSDAILLYDREIILEDTPKRVTDFYQKLVFSKNKQQVLDEINGKVWVEMKEEKKKEEKKVVKKEIKEDKKYFLPSLVSTPQYINKELASFTDIKILSDSNEKVNILKINHKYTLSFDVTFHEELDNIRFGIQFKTLKGGVISGCNTRDYENKKVYSVTQNDKHNVSMEFDCLILHGTYVIRLIVANDYVQSIIEDAHIFQVKTGLWRQGGLITLKQKIKHREQRIC